MFQCSHSAMLHRAGHSTAEAEAGHLVWPAHIFHPIDHMMYAYCICVYVGVL